MIVTFSFFFLRKRHHVILQAGDIVETLAGCTPGVELGRDEPREHVLALRWRPVRMTASGLQAEEPVMANEDTVDSTLFITECGLSPAPLTAKSEIQHDCYRSCGRTPAVLRIQRRLTGNISGG